MNLTVSIWSKQRIIDIQNISKLEWPQKSVISLANSYFISSLDFSKQLGWNFSINFVPFLKGTFCFLCDYNVILGKWSKSTNKAK